MKIGRRVLHAGIVAGGLLWMHAVATQDLHAQRLPIGSITGGTTNSENTATFQFSAETAGILTVVVRSTDETDLVLYFRVSMFGTPDSPISYRLSIGFIPD